MNSSRMKNMIVLRNLPSNIIDEAFVVLKNNKKIKVPDNNENQNTTVVAQKDSKNYIVNEAEMLINNYLSKLENDKYVKSSNVKRLEKKCKKMRVIIAILALTLFITVVF